MCFMQQERLRRRRIQGPLFGCASSELLQCVRYMQQGHDHASVPWKYLSVIILSVSVLFKLEQSMLKSESGISHVCAVPGFERCACAWIHAGICVPMIPYPERQ